ncbi:SPOR domain-containing protein [Sphingopyxis sp. PET50]|uniref:SPOR domain-containing protein n=1 Tax=Sphingopyxis sp. PET50 TaxID=2976533 RepID=UPI0021AEDFBC|nr:SPOR domain-containing protein [Sphingopyxis sp. PET50]
MKRNLLMKLAVSGFVLGLTTSGCSMSKMANAPSNTLGKPETAVKSASLARTALEAGKTSKAVGLAEAAVAASPRDGAYRALLGQAYLSDGRFASAAAALTEAMELGVTDTNTVLALTLAHIAQNRTSDALALLNAHRDTLPAPDTGLALALAGDVESAIYVLTEAARVEGASARTRQNLALAYALSGRWAQARILASQDLSLAKLEGRMAEWSALANEENSAVRVASLIGVKAQADAGMPVRLALANFADTQMAAADAPMELASADPAPVDAFAPAPPAAGRLGDPRGRTADAAARRQWRGARHRAAGARRAGDPGRNHALSRRAARRGRGRQARRGSRRGARAGRDIRAAGRRLRSEEAFGLGGAARRL